jgi:hypothetical protein
VVCILSGVIYSDYVFIHYIYLCVLYFTFVVCSLCCRPHITHFTSFLILLDSLFVCRVSTYFSDIVYFIRNTYSIVCMK